MRSRRLQCKSANQSPAWACPACRALHWRAADKLGLAPGLTAVVTNGRPVPLSQSTTAVDFELLGLVAGKFRGATALRRTLAALQAKGQLNQLPTGGGDGGNASNGDGTGGSGGGEDGGAAALSDAVMLTAAQFSGQTYPVSFAARFSFISLLSRSSRPATQWSPAACLGGAMRSVCVV